MYIYIYVLRICFLHAIVIQRIQMGNQELFVCVQNYTAVARINFFFF